MATSENTAALQQQPTDNQPQGKICYGDCFRCSYQQAWMCASMHARRTMRTTEELMEAIGILTQTVTELKAQVSDLQAKFDKAELINPLDETTEADDEQESEPLEDEEEMVMWPDTKLAKGPSATEGIKNIKRKR